MTCGFVINLASIEHTPPMRKWLYKHDKRQIKRSIFQIYSNFYGPSTKSMNLKIIFEH